MSANALCLGCFNTASHAPEPCPLCGWDDAKQGRGLHLAAGQLLHGRYVLGRLLGQGGFGITYLGWDENLAVKVAVKEYLCMEWASRLPGSTTVQAHTGKEAEFSSGVASFLEEARTLAKFKQHLNIATVTEFFEANGTGYLVMDYVEGMTFKQYLAGQPGGVLPWRQALPIFIQTMDGLRAAHAKDLAHRDISPDNIYLEMSAPPQPRVLRALLLDFGNARHYDAEKSRSFSAVLKDGYAPPEQYSRKGKQGPWTDVYALGATLYKTLTGLIPPQALDRRHEDDLAPIITLVPDLPPPLAEAVHKALQLNVSERYQCIDEMLPPLLGLLGNAPPQPPPLPPHDPRTVAVPPLVDARTVAVPLLDVDPPALPPSVPSSRRAKPYTVAVAGAVVLLLSVGGFYAAWQKVIAPSDADKTMLPSKAVVTPPKTSDAAAPAAQADNAATAAAPLSRLTLQTEPADAKVEIIEPAQDYRPGMSLPPGRYKVKISAAGYKTQEETLNLDPGEQKPRIALAPAPATLSVQTAPPGAQVSIVTTPDGSRPRYQDGMALPPGNYRIEVARKGYKTRSETVTLTAGEAQRLTVTLAEKIPVIPNRDKERSKPNDDFWGNISKQTSDFTHYNK